MLRYPILQRARAYLCNSLPAGTRILDTTAICPAFASGEELYTECIMPAAHVAMLDFFKEVAVQGDTFVNTTLEVFGDGIEPEEQILRRSANAA